MNRFNNKIWLISVVFLVFSHTVIVNAAPIVYPTSNIKFQHGCPKFITAENGYIHLLSNWSRGNGLLSINATNPKQLKYESGVPGMGYPLSYVRNKGFIYVPTWFSLMVVDARKPGELKIARNILLDFSVRSACAKCAVIAKNELYIGGNTGLRVMDVSVPDAPVLKSVFPELGSISAILAHNGILFLFGKKQIDIIKIEKSGYKRLGKMKNPGMKQAVVTGKTLYILTKRNHLKIYDLSNPTKVAQLQKGNILNNSKDIVCMKKTGKSKINVVTKGGDLLFINCADALDPKVEKTVKLPENLRCSNVDFAGNTMYALDIFNSCLMSLNISKATAVILGKIPIVTSEGAIDLERGNIIISSSSRVKLDIFMLKTGERIIQTPMSVFTSPIRKGEYFRTYDVMPATAMKRVNDYLLVGDGLLEIKDSAKLAKIKPVTQSAAVIKKFGDRACVLLKKKLIIEDISKLPEIKTIEEFQFNPEIMKVEDVELIGDCVYLLRSTAKYLPPDNCITVLDSDAMMIPDATIKGVQQSVSFVKSGSYLYVPSFKGGDLEKQVVVVDVSIPRKPRIVKRVKGIIANKCRLIKQIDGKLFLIDNPHGIKELDISDPLNPELKATYNGKPGELNTYSDLTVKDGILYGRRYSGIDMWKIPKK